MVVVVVVEGVDAAAAVVGGGWLVALDVDFLFLLLRRLMNDRNRCSSRRFVLLLEDSSEGRCNTVCSDGSESITLDCCRRF